MQSRPSAVADMERTGKRARLRSGPSLGHVLTARAQMMHKGLEHCPYPASILGIDRGIDEDR